MLWADPVSIRTYGGISQLLSLRSPQRMCPACPGVDLMSSAPWSFPKGCGKQDSGQLAANLQGALLLGSTAAEPAKCLVPLPCKGN